jgi:hypothetical protein
MERHLLPAPVRELSISGSDNEDAATGLPPEQQQLSDSASDCDAKSPAAKRSFWDCIDRTYEKL